MRICGNSLHLVRIKNLFNLSLLTWLTLPFSSIFNTACAVGTNGLAFLMPVEMTPLQTRGKSVAISTGLFWLCNFFVVMISPVLISRIGYGTYVLWASTNLCFIPMIYFLGMRSPYPILKYSLRTLICSPGNLQGYPRRHRCLV
jgi:hypothetical protein